MHIDHAVGGPVRQVGITAVASCLPELEVTSHDLQEQITMASGLRLPARMLERVTGIVSRRSVAEGEYASTLAVRAARTALSRAGLNPYDVDLLVFASATRDVAEPATAHIVQAELGSRAHALDVTNACNSFVNGIDTARAMILAGRARRALVVTGETPSRAVQRAPSGPGRLRDGFAGYTFGDAGAAVVLEAVDRGGILDVDTETHSEHWSVGGIFGGGSRHPRGDEHTYFHGDGSELREVFEKVGTSVLDRMRQRTGLAWNDFRHILVHQVTVPYLERFVELTGVPRDRLVVTVPELGNMASATLGVQLDLVHGELGPGDRVLFVGLGGGVSIMTMVWEKA
ncbi:3-oxoacyl-[acyl-carrier-protein] synthase-3 [Streptomyces griseochromogenes]|uniref:3-oxoacyl-ACP synthase n=1 Tax=Streptomyces griseochromogenes TaxID=68214 RepID=A0A1B1AYJ8_9ACTN|nr:ketoacyl-ACP synthase III [Streptomyces griseochromogenes]ANP51611.1 3-oxoacyl-ACP synthase [Streptomyces griseochromogenes]MBP2054288.1 3-oxoacyl-[acyl-carrier-protein] synthase-3 [Streptomyces griseochromogenes]